MSDALGFLRIARENARDAVRERTVYTVGGSFLLFGLLGGLAYVNGVNSQTDGSQLAEVLVYPILILGAIAALSQTYSAVNGPRANGSLKLLLSLPYSRRDYLLGTHLGRLAVLWVATAGLVAVTLLIAVATGSPTAPGMTVGVLLASFTYLLSFTSIGIGVSAAVKSTTRAAAIMVGIFAIFFVVWPLLRPLVFFLLSGFGNQPDQIPTWFQVLSRMNPQYPFKRLVLVILDTQSSSILGVGVPPAPQREFFHTTWFAALLSAFWAVVPPLLGGLRFERSDL